MKFKNYVSVSALCICLFFLFGFNSFAFGASEKETIFISTGEYAPWTGKNLKNSGFINHIIAEAFKQEGYQVAFEYFPWKRNYEEAKKGKFHATSYWYRSAEREKDFYYSDPLSVEKLVFFHLAATPMIDWKILDDLAPYRIGATRGYTYTKEFWEAEKSKKLMIDVTNTDKQNFQKLLRGRIDIFPSGLVSGKGVLQKEFDAHSSALITYHPHPLSETTGHLLFLKTLKGSKTLVATFNRGLAKLKESGLYQTLTNDLLAGKYGQ